MKKKTVLIVKNTFGGDKSVKEIIRRLLERVHTYE